MFGRCKYACPIAIGFVGPPKWFGITSNKAAAFYFARQLIINKTVVSTARD
jgi:hypothetical protein